MLSSFYGKRGSLSVEAHEGATTLHVASAFNAGWAFFNGMRVDCVHKNELLLRVTVKKADFERSTLELEEPLPDDLGAGTDLYRADLLPWIQPMHVLTVKEVLERYS